MKKNLVILSLIVIEMVSLELMGLNKQVFAQTQSTWWDIQSIDTMKYSRDYAREKNHSNAFLEIIDTQVKDIAATGATHVAIATPYDEEFLPFLKSWVEAARKYGLNVWFRGNWSGWEQWFGYNKITREEHIKKSGEFVNKNSSLFENGDIFSACPECENGGPGDPRVTMDIAGHRKFLIEEYTALKNEFIKAGKNVQSNFSPMNGDVAKLIMDEETTKALGGLVVIDHYVETPAKLINDINYLAGRSGGKIFLGEFGVPIPDINGRMTEKEQADWINTALDALVKDKNVVGINYWVNIDGSTSIWSSTGKPRQAVETLTKYFKPKLVEGVVINEIGKPLKNVKVKDAIYEVKTKEDGKFAIKYIDEKSGITVSVDGYMTKYISPISQNEMQKIVLIKEQETAMFRIQKFFYKLFHRD
jgi:hypothetical protein